MLPETPEKYREHWTRYWAAIWKLTRTILQTENIIPGRSCAITEIVHCKSNAEKGVKEAREACVEKYLNRIFNLAQAPIIILLGNHATDIINKKYKLDILPATEKNVSQNHSVVAYIGNKKRLILAIPAPNNRKTRGLTWLKPDEKDILLQWGQEAFIET